MAHQVVSRFARRPTTNECGDGLLNRAVQGDTGALSELLRRHGPAVEQTLRISRQWRTALDPADVMQVTYLEAFMEIGRFDPVRAGSFAAWLRQIAEHNLHDAIRGLERQKQPQPDNRIDLPPAADSSGSPFELLGLTTTTPSRQAGRNEFQQILEHALRKLPADYAAAVRLYDLDGRSMSEVATALGRSAAAVHMLRARALDRLRELLGTESAYLGSRP